MLILGAVSALVAGPASAQVGDEPVVTNAVQVTGNPNPVRAHSSPQIAVNPDTGELVIVETNVFGDFAVKVHTSTDDGRTWFPGGDPMIKPFTWNSDYAINGPYFTMAFDSDAVLYVAFTATDPAFADRNRSERPRHVFLARSSDSGRTWETTSVFRGTDSNPDNRRPTIAVDPHDSRYVYVGWMQPTGGRIAASNDGGNTFGEPTPMRTDDRRHYQPRLAVDGKGVVHAVFPSGEFNPTNPIVRPVWYRQSTDHGRTWSEAVVIEPGSAGFFHNRKHVLAADPISNNLYFVWYGTTKEVPTAADDNEIFVRVSSDGGATWSDRITINDDASRVNTQHYDPGISIAPNGRVDVAWYDFRNSAEPEKLPVEFAAPFNVGGFNDVYYSSSTDGGRTWSENTRISDRLIDRNIGVWSNNVHSHYNVGIASTNDSVYFAWQDSRAGNAVTNAEDVYFASLKLDPDDILVGASSGTTNAWPLAIAGVMLGMGIAMVLAFLVTRRRPTPQHIPT
ncbi:MAG: sialidase family protein [Acidimicrobiales bacterium]